MGMCPSTHRFKGMTRRAGGKKEPEETEQENTKEENQGRMVSQKLMR